MTLYFLVAAKYPHVQARAQAEMDKVVGPNRLPTFSDREALPYLDALCKELFRYLPIVPLGTGNSRSCLSVCEVLIFGSCAAPRNAR